MTLVLDTSGLLAAIDGDQRSHESVRDAVQSAEGPLVISPFVLAELDYLLRTRVGFGAEMVLLNEVERRVYRLEAFSARDVAEARAVIERYADLGLGLADASNVVLAGRYGTREILTLDQRHFRTVTAFGGQPFRLLPADL